LQAYAEIEIRAGPKEVKEGMYSDSELRTQVERELEWEPSVDAHRIGVTVEDGVVTLTGEVKSYAEEWKAERTVERVKGVRAIANDLAVHLTNEYSDTDLAKAASEALKSNIAVPSERIRVKVEKGWLTLEGDVPWDYQRRAAARAVRNLAGIRGVSNLITIRPQAEPKEIKTRVEETFKREAAYDASRVTVEVSGSEVTLRGMVRSWAERHEAEKAAWAAPGVTAVHNYIHVDPALVVA
jgi:osmotically-inducible protein OsmY